MKVTINDFVRYRKLKQERTRLSRQVIKLEESNGQWVKDKVTGSSPEFPYVSHSVPVIGLLHNTARINAKKDQLAEMEAEMLDLLERFKAFLPTVEDIEVRETLELYYIDGVSYRNIAIYLGLEGDGSTQMKKVHRYMRKVSAHSANRNGIV